jgi:hypothetical protein
VCHSLARVVIHEHDCLKVGVPVVFVEELLAKVLDGVDLDIAANHNMLRLSLPVGVTTVGGLQGFQPQ